MTKEYTIKDIAKIADVSISTVSRVINDSAPVSDDLKQRVLKVLDKIDYNPNGMARGLVRNESNIVGVVIPDLANPFYPEIVKGIEDILSVNGFSMILCNTNYKKEKEKTYINDLIERRIEGLIIVSTYLDNKKLINKIRKRVNIVSIQTSINNVDTVDTTNEKGVFEAVDYLIKNGHNKIAFLGFGYKVLALHQRLAGYKKALKKHDIPIRDDYIIEGGITREEGYYNTLKLLESGDTPSAIMAINDNTALGALLAIEKEGLTVPDDISVVGFDNIITSRLTNPKLTTVSQPIYRMGETAGKLLLQNLNDRSSDKNEQVILPTKLIIRDSVRDVS